MDMEFDGELDQEEEIDETVLKMLENELSQEGEEELPVDFKEYSNIEAQYFEDVGKIRKFDKKETLELARKLEEAKLESFYRCPLLSFVWKDFENVPSLCRRYYSHNFGQEAVRIRDELLKGNLAWVIKVAKRYMGRGKPFLDLIEEGNLGLMRAVEKYDYRRGYALTTYATWHIRQSIARSIATSSKVIKIPSHLFNAYGRIARAEEQLWIDTGRKPLLEEISERSGVPLYKIVAIKSHKEVISLDSPINDEAGDETIGSMVAYNGKTTEEVLYEIDLRSHLEKLLMSISEREEKVLRLRFGILEGDRYGQDYTLEETGDFFGVTRERIRQIENKALKKIKHPKRRAILKPFAD